VDATEQQVGARSLYTSSGYVSTGRGEFQGQSVIFMEKTL